MSMLTPPGMGGEYRIKGDKYPRMRRPRHRRRIVLTILACVVALGLAGWGTVQLVGVFTGGEQKTTAGGRKADCKPDPTPVASAARILPTPAQITVNVYNATPRGGLAKTTADELKARGFVIGKVGNASVEYDKKVPGTGILLGAPGAYEGAFRVLGTQVRGTQLKADTRTTEDVDLIIGTAFTALTARPAADQALSALNSKPTAPKPGCQPQAS
ncbi:LytR C-terminal domain-containing protein [Streptomyces sannanensis]|uniref:LytR C-terminal domain-containing protein n=1 Tax=Streptomyces sannanensis TaxID=285536 RepID=A0ABP6SCL8_9ACTN